MADDLRNFGAYDGTRINVNEKWERTYWSRKFGCTEEQLAQAIKKVGVMSNNVKAALGKITLT